MAMALSLVACGSSSGSGDSSEGKTLKVFIYANEQESDIYKNMIQEYQDSHDDIAKIDVQITTQDEYGTTLTGMMTAGDLPDVFYVGPESVSQYVDNGYILDMQPVMDQLGIDTSDMMQDILSAYRYDGTSTGSGDLYAVPKDASVFAYAYNKDLFDEAGLDYPDPEHPYTYEEFVEVCQALTKDTDGDGEIDQWGCGCANAYMLYQYVWSNGASFLSDDYKTVTIDTPEFKDALQKFVDLTLKYKVTPTVEQDASLGVYQRWLAGQEGFYAAGTWDVAAFMDDETFPYNWDLCAYPTLSTGKSMTWLGTVGYCVSATTENPEEAVALANYLSTDADGQREVSGITTGESIQLPNIVSLAEGEFVDAVQDGSLPYPSNVDVLFNYMNGNDNYGGRFMESNYTPNSEWADIFFNGLDNVKNGSMSVDDYIASVQDEMQESLDNAWASVE
jgi:multiple sugar transport system substrate-binding protein